MNTTASLLTRLVPCHHTTLARGDLLFRQDDHIDHLYVIHKGRIKLTRPTVDGNVAILQMALAGDILAEASLFFDRYHCDAIVDSKISTLCCFPREALLAACQQSAATAMQLAELFAHRIRKLRTLMEIRNIRSAKQRINAFLQLEAGSDNTIQRIMTYRDMAYQIGLAHETFYRTLRQLETERRIVRDRQTILIAKS